MKNHSAKFITSLSDSYGRTVSEAEANECKDKLMKFFALLQQMDEESKQKSKEEVNDDKSNRDPDRAN